MKRTLLLFTLIGIAGLCSAATEVIEKPISPEVAGKNAVYAMMSANSYHDSNEPFHLQELGWIQVDSDGNQTTKPALEDKKSGLAYDLYQQIDSDKKVKKVVFAFRGTEIKSPQDIAANIVPAKKSPQYNLAFKAVGAYIKRNKLLPENVALTGHSLGGGIALHVSAKLGLDAITFDASPRVFFEHKTPKPANRTIIYQKGEVLQSWRDKFQDWKPLVTHGNVYQTKFAFDSCEKEMKEGDAEPFCLHRQYPLTLGILKLAQANNPQQSKP